MLHSKRQFPVSQESAAIPRTLLDSSQCHPLHTRFGDDCFQDGVAAAIERLDDYRELETHRILTLQSTALPDATAESVVFRAWEKGIVGTRLLRPLLDEWRKPTFDDFQECHWALQNGANCVGHIDRRSERCGDNFAGVVKLTAAWARFLAGYARAGIQLIRPIRWQILQSHY